MNFGFTGPVAETYEIYKQAAVAQPYDADTCAAAYDAWLYEIARPVREMSEQIAIALNGDTQERAA